MNARWETVSALILLGVSLPACAWLAMRQVQSGSDLAAARSRMEQERNTAAVATLNSIALPANAPLGVCNHGRNRVQVTTLAGVFAEPGGNLDIFNSARSQWRTWDVPAGAHIPLEMRESGWNGQAIFYAMDVTAAGTRRLVAGTSRDLQSGCVDLFAQSERTR